MFHKQVLLTSRLSYRDLFIIEEYRRCYAIGQNAPSSMAVNDLEGHVRLYNEIF